MTLATHAVVGAALAELFPSHPVIAFCVGFSSHFIFDAIPHWDYKILSSYANPDVAMAENEQMADYSENISRDRLFYLDLIRIGCDALLGCVAVVILLLLGLFSYPGIAWIGVFSAVLPDFLQFVYMRLPYEPMVSLQKFHQWMHAELRPFKQNPALGIFLQVVIVVVVFVLVRSLYLL